MKTNVAEKIANYIYGYCTVRISGYAERALSALLTSGINYWGLYRDGDSIILSLPERQYKSLVRVLEGSSCRVDGVITRGAKATARRHFRPGVIVGALIFCAVLFFSTCFIWDISVTGNSAMTEWEIIETLEAYGVRYGAFIPSLDLEKICIDYAHDSDDVSWFSVNMSGTCADVVVRERRDNDNTWQSDTPSNIIAAEDGQIRRFCVWSGESLMHIGQVVKKGDILISGVNDIVNYLTKEVYGYALDRSYGSVYAEVHRTYTVEIPLDHEEKTYTGRQFTEKNYKFFTKALKTFGNSGKKDGFYDKIESKDRVMLFDTLKLPIFRTVTVYKEYESKVIPISEEQAALLAEAKMMKLLADELAGCELEKRTFSGEIKDGVYILSCDVYCIADIAKEVEIYHGTENGEN